MKAKKKTDGFAGIALCEGKGEVMATTVLLKFIQKSDGGAQSAKVNHAD